MRLRPPSGETAVGAAYAFGSFLIWGLSPLYWRLLDRVPAGEVFLHRIAWSAALMAFLLRRREGLAGLRAALGSRRALGWLLATAALIGTNWYLFIRAIAERRVLDASLGYFINPLLTMSLGVVLLGERLRRLQTLAVALAALGVAWEIHAHGRVPGLSLALAGTFALYALLRKKAPLDAMTAVTAETLLAAVPAVAALAWLAWSGGGAFGPARPLDSLLLAGGALVTATPLLWFSEGTRRLSLKTLGFLQFTSPTLKFLCAVAVFGEPLAGRLPAFLLVGAGAFLYALDAARVFGPAEA